MEAPGLKVPVPVTTVSAFVDPKASGWRAPSSPSLIVITPEKLLEECKFNWPGPIFSNPAPAPPLMLARMAKELPLPCSGVLKVRVALARLSLPWMLATDWVEKWAVTSALRPSVPDPVSISPPVIVSGPIVWLKPFKSSSPERLTVTDGPMVICPGAINRTTAVVSAPKSCPATNGPATAGEADLPSSSVPASAVVAPA